MTATTPQAVQTVLAQEYGTNDLLNTAMVYASWGWPVFPLQPGSKEPFKGSHGFKEATTDLDTIITCWTQHPYANVAIATGEPGPDVVDIDVTDGKPGLDTRARLAAAKLLRGAHAEVVTASGGQHLYYRGTQQACGARKRDGIDFRSQGGYVVAAGSMVNGRRYVVSDGHRPRAQAGTVDWAAICRYLAPKPQAQEFSRLVPTAGPGLAAWAQRRLQELLQEPAEDRSARFHGLVGLCRTAGMNQAEAVLVLEPWCDMVGKYIGRVDREVSRCWDKVQVAA